MLTNPDTFAQTMSIDVDGKSLADVSKECERFYLQFILTKYGGNRTKAAKAAGLSLPTFRDKLSRYTVKTSIELI